MEIITKRKFISKIKEIQAGPPSVKLYLLKYLFSFLKPCGLSLKEAKDLMDNNYDPLIIDKLYLACENHIKEYNKFSRNKLEVLKNSSYVMYKCVDNPYANQYNGEFTCECICNKREECKKTAVAIIDTLITRRNLD